MSGEELKIEFLKIIYFFEEIDGYLRIWWIEDCGLLRLGFWWIDVVFNKLCLLLDDLVFELIIIMLFFICVD